MKYLLILFILVGFSSLSDGAEDKSKKMEMPKIFSSGDANKLAMFWPLNDNLISVSLAMISVVTSLLPSTNLETGILRLFTVSLS